MIWITHIKHTAYVHTHLRRTTLRHITSHQTTLHNITPRYITSHYITTRYVTYITYILTYMHAHIHKYMHTLHAYIACIAYADVHAYVHTPPKFITLHYVTWHYAIHTHLHTYTTSQNLHALHTFMHHIAFHHIKSHHTKSHYITSHGITLQHVKYINARMHACMRTHPRYIHAWVPYMHYICACIHACAHACPQTWITCMHTYLHTSIHNRHTCMHARTHALHNPQPLLVISFLLTILIFFWSDLGASKLKLLKQMKLKRFASSQNEAWADFQENLTT